ncbi:MAG: hypothetical protein KF850_31875 [Labilithrix sp.]|nr:hypothetical protein [Labilithrix sp.]
MAPSSVSPSRVTPPRVAPSRVTPRVGAFSGARAALLATVLAAPAALVACSNDAEPGSCFRGHDNACVDYDRPQAAAGKRMCAGMTWTAGEKSCPRSDRLGSCNKPSGAEWVYRGAPNNYGPESAKSACELNGGTFTPAPPSVP